MAFIRIQIAWKYPQGNRICQKTLITCQAWNRHANKNITLSGLRWHSKDSPRMITQSWSGLQILFLMCDCASSLQSSLSAHVLFLSFSSPWFGEMSESRFPKSSFRCFVPLVGHNTTFGRFLFGLAILNLPVPSYNHPVPSYNQLFPFINIIKWNRVIIRWNRVF